MMILYSFVLLVNFFGFTLPAPQRGLPSDMQAQSQKKKVLFPQPSLVQTVLLVSLQANEDHEGQKSGAHAGAYWSGGSRLEGASTLCWRMAGACRVLVRAKLLTKIVCNRQPRQQAAKACQKHCWMLPCKDCSIKHRLRYSKKSFLQHEQLSLQRFVALQSTDHKTENIGKTTTFNFKNLFLHCRPSTGHRLASTMA